MANTFENTSGWETTKDYILNMMGYPTVAVELTEKQLYISIRQALEKYFEYRVPCLKHHYFAVNPGQDIYDLPDEAIHHTEQGIKIKGVIYKPSNFEQFQYYFQYTLYNYKPVSVANIHMMFQNLEAFKYVTGQEVSFEILNGSQIRISPMPNEPTQGAVIYAANLPESDLDQNPWIWKYSLAISKQIVGRVRSKFTIPSPTGGEVNLAGAELVAESKEEIRDLEQHLKDTQEPMPFLVG